MNAACWAAITPSLWVPDEVAHTGYAQYLAETGRLPLAGSRDPGFQLRPPGLTEEQAVVYEALPFGVEGSPSWVRASDDRLRQQLAREGLGRSRPGEALYLVNNPPLYYALQVGPYRLAYGASFLDRLFAMRLLSSLLAGVTVLFVFLFLRELLPRVRWAWTVGSLAVAFQPVLGFIGGGVNNDVLIYATSAALLFGVARAFRRGLSPATGALIGGSAALGLLTKATTAGLLPGMLVALAVLCWRAARSDRRRAALSAAMAVALTVLPFMAWSALRPQGAPEQASGLASGSVGGGVDQLREQASYVWQALLPRLPFMEDQIPVYTPWETFFKGFVGRFGYFEYGFATTWYWVALALFAVIAVLAGVELWRRRGPLRGRWAELTVYAVMVGGFLVALEVVAYRYHEAVPGAYFEQARYLFPLLALYGALVALAVRGAGRRWGPPIGVLLVVLAMGHSLFSQLLTVARFYA